MINFTAVYSKRREASGFCCFNYKMKGLKPATHILVSLVIIPGLQK